MSTTKVLTDDIAGTITIGAVTPLARNASAWNASGTISRSSVFAAR